MLQYNIHVTFGAIYKILFCKKKQNTPMYMHSGKIMSIIGPMCISIIGAMCEYMNKALNKA